MRNLFVFAVLPLVVYYCFFPVINEKQQQQQEKFVCDPNAPCCGTPLDPCPPGAVTAESIRKEKQMKE